MPPVIDAHIHLIQPFDAAGRPQRYSVWKEDGTPKPTSAEDFIALMDACGIDQAFYISWSAETARILGGNALDFMKGGPPGLTPQG